MLAMKLSQTDKLPHDLARQMAGDVDEVAGPVLQYSETLTDADLVSIVDSLADAKKLESIARRDSVSETLSDVLVNTSFDSVLNTLVQNEGANIAEHSFEKIVERCHDNAEVMESLIQRGSVPLAVMEKATQRLSDEVRQQLERKYGNLAEMKTLRATLDQNLKSACVKMMSLKSFDKEQMQLVHLLNETDTLPTFAALSLCSLPLFEMSLSRLLHIPARNMHILLQDPVGFKTVYERANLPQALFEAAELAIHAIRQLEEERSVGAGSKEALGCGPVMERMRELSVGQKFEGLDYLYAMMRHIAAKS